MKVIIADDHRIVREGIATLLASEADIELVGEASTGDQLLDLMETTEVDVVLLDVRMPDKSGLDVLEELRGRSQLPSFIVLSMHDDPSYVKRAVELGASGYLLKSVGKDELIRALGVVAEGGSYIQGEITAPLIARMVDPTGAGPVGDLSPREVETLGMLAERYYGDSRRSDLLRSYNQIDDPRRLSVGEKIEIPLILPLSETPPPDPPAAPEPAPPARRFEGQLRTARGAFHAGSFEDALETLAPLIQPIEHEGTSLDRTELWALLAFVYVAFDRNEEACTAYGLAVSASSQSPLDPVLVSPKIRKALANCR